MSYISKRLAPGETVEVEGRFHWLQYFFAWMALIFLGVILVGIVIWLREMVRLNTTEFVVTNRRVILKKGWLSVNTDEITLSAIEGSHIEQSLLGRLFGYGRLTVRGRGDTHIMFPTMARPMAFRSAAEGARMAEESKPVEVVPAAVTQPEKPHKLTRDERKALKDQRKIAAHDHRHAHS